MATIDQCPVCGGEMQCGYILDARGVMTYWLPENKKYMSMALSRKRIESLGGVVLGTETKLGFYAKERSKSYFCAHCNLIITVVDDLGEPNEISILN